MRAQAARPRHLRPRHPQHLQPRRLRPLRATAGPHPDPLHLRPGSGPQPAVTGRVPRGGGRGRRLAGVTAAVATMVAAGPVPLAAAAPDSPGGFVYGTDSWGPGARGGAAPYRVPGTGSLDGGYVGELGTWTDWTGCTRGYAMVDSTVARVNADEAYGDVPGVFYYWYAAGPGADPGYNGTWAEAYRWGVAQAERADHDYALLAARGYGTTTRYIPLLFMDIEGQDVRGYGNGWNERVNRCGRITRRTTIPPAVDRATFDGFTDYTHLDTIFHPGVYSTPSYWSATFGTGPASQVPNTYQWTAVHSTPSVLPGPVAFAQSGGGSARWFGGVRPDRRAGWQWTQSNGGDYDQWDTANLPRP